MWSLTPEPRWLSSGHQDQQSWMGSSLVASFLCAAGMLEISGALPRLPTAVWTFHLSWRADISDSKVVVTGQLCAIPACVVEV